MSLSRRLHTSHENELRLTLDARKRISLAKLLPINGISSFKAYTEGDKIILEPMAEIPASEVWLSKQKSETRRADTKLRPQFFPRTEKTRVGLTKITGTNFSDGRRFIDFDRMFIN